MAKRDKAVDAWIEKILVELRNATDKYPNWPTDPLHAIAIVMEEAGELQKAVLQEVYEPHKNGGFATEEEAVQLGAMIIRFLLSGRHYEYRPCPQHAQEGVW